MPVVPAIPGFNPERQIAAGRHGVVWAARRRGDDKAVALKLVPAERVADAARFLREAEALAALNHSNIVHCLGSGRHEDTLWLAMERADHDLNAELRAGPLAPTRLLAIGRDAAAGLAAIHACGLIHRDLTPANLLAMADGRVVLGDFGLVHGGLDRLTATGEVLGTPAYLSPEQASGAPVEPRSDIYALGAVLYALATGQPPFQGDGAWGVVQQIAKGPFPDPREQRPDLPLELRAIIRAATGLRPEERYATADLLGEDCTSVLAGGTPRHAGALRARLADTVPELPAPPPPRRPIAPFAIAAGALAAGLLAGWLLGRPDAGERAAFARARDDGGGPAWQAYLERFPDGRGAGAARRALAVHAARPAGDGAETQRLQERIRQLQPEAGR